MLLYKQYAAKKSLFFVSAQKILVLAAYGLRRIKGVLRVEDGKLRMIAEEWPRVAPRLLRFVMDRIGQRRLPMGHEAEDVVQMAFRRLIAGDREWRPERVDLLTHMKRSILRSMLGSKGLPTVKDIAAGELTDADEEKIVDGEGVPITALPKDSICDMDKEAAFTFLEQEVAGEPELANVLAAVRLGYYKPRDIAEVAGYEAKQVYGLLKKLASRAEMAGEKWGDGRRSDNERK